jgi:elongation factor Tu
VLADRGGSRFVPFERIDRAPEEIARGITINVSHVEYETPGRHAGEPVGSVVTGLETFGRSLDHVQAGDNAAVLLRGVRRHQVRRGQVLVRPGTLRPWRRFRADLHVLTAAEGGRRTGFRSGYRPQFHVRTADTVGEIDLGPVTRARPGDDVAVAVELGAALPLDVGLGFAVREGGLTVAAGQVTELLD